MTMKVWNRSDIHLPNEISVPVSRIAEAVRMINEEFAELREQGISCTMREGPDRSWHHDIRMPLSTAKHEED